jgi:hypothetical protein
VGSPDTFESVLHVHDPQPSVIWDDKLTSGGPLIMVRGELERTTLTDVQKSGDRKNCIVALKIPREIPDLLLDETPLVTFPVARSPRVPAIDGTEV